MIRITAQTIMAPLSFLLRIWLGIFADKSPTVMGKSEGQGVLKASRGFLRNVDMCHGHQFL